MLGVVLYSHYVVSRFRVLHWLLIERYIALRCLRYQLLIKGCPRASRDGYYVVRAYRQHQRRRCLLM
jgi:hypothetical protein